MTLAVLPIVTTIHNLHLDRLVHESPFSTSVKLKVHALQQAYPFFIRYTVRMLQSVGLSICSMSNNLCC